MTPWAQVISETALVTVFVFITMLMVDYANTATVGRFARLMKSGRWRQYLVASFIGVTPGCVGPFMNVSFYEHGLLSFGALTGGMAAAVGDEAFVMLVLFPKTAILLFLLLAGIGIIWGFATDRIVQGFSLKPSLFCDLQKIHTLETCQCPDHNSDKKRMTRRVLGVSVPRAVLLLATGCALILIASGLLGSKEWDWEKITLVVLVAVGNVIVGSASDHYLREHIWNHLVKKHLGRIFLWTFGALVMIHFGFRIWDLEGFVHSHASWMVILSALVGLIPESGPHLVFVVLFSKGLIPFSVLLANAVVQDGHGMLPLLGFSVRDAAFVKLFNLVLGLIIGTVLFILGF